MITCHVAEELALGVALGVLLGTLGMLATVSTGGAEGMMATTWLTLLEGTSRESDEIGFAVLDLHHVTPPAPTTRATSGTARITSGNFVAVDGPGGLSRVAPRSVRAPGMTLRASGVACVEARTSAAPAAFVGGTTDAGARI